MKACFGGRIDCTKIDFLQTDFKFRQTDIDLYRAIIEFLHLVYIYVESGILERISKTCSIRKLIDTPKTVYPVP